MAVATFATASPTPLALSQARNEIRAMSPVTRGALFTLGGHLTSLARPIAIAWFARLYGASTLGGFVLTWTLIELGARLATMGFDRGLQRWADELRVAATVAGMAMAGITALAMASTLYVLLPRFSALNHDAVRAAQLLLLVALPLTAVSNVALRAARGTTQIGTYILARGVTEPLLLLFAGLMASPHGNGSVALPACLMISVTGGAVVAGFGLVKTFGARQLLASLVRIRAWPVRKLVRTSLPLGLADLLQGAQAKLDLVAVAIVTFSARAITSYAIAVEVAGVFVALRIGFDQLVAPLSAEARGNRAELQRILTTTTRWSLMAAAPIGFMVLIAPEVLLRWFGGSEGAALVLLVLAAGRAVEMVLAPVASMLAIVGAPKLSLLNTAVGLAIAVTGQLAAAILGLGIVAIAVASALGVVVSSLLAVYWLAQLEGISMEPQNVAAEVVHPSNP